jgi:hypothetical protein
MSILHAHPSSPLIDADWTMAQEFGQGGSPDHGDYVRSYLLGVVNARASNLVYLFAIV